MMLNELSTKRQPKAMTTKEIARQLTVAPKTIRENAKKCLPNKRIENGKQTFFTNEEATVLIDYMKKHKGNNRRDLYLEGIGAIATATTSMTNALRIRNAMLEMQAAYEDELSIIKAEKARLATDNKNLQIRLDESKDWYTVKRMEKLNKGMSFDWRMLKRESERLGIEVKKVFDQNYGEVNAYHKDVWESLYFDTLDFEE